MRVPPEDVPAPTVAKQNTCPGNTVCAGKRPRGLYIERFRAPAVFDSHSAWDSVDCVCVFDRIHVEVAQSLFR